MKCRYPDIIFECRYPNAVRRILEARNTYYTFYPRDFDHCIVDYHLLQRTHERSKRSMRHTKNCRHGWPLSPSSADTHLSVATNSAYSSTSATGTTSTHGTPSTHGSCEHDHLHEAQSQMHPTQLFSSVCEVSPVSSTTSASSLQSEQSQTDAFPHPPTASGCCWNNPVAHAHPNGHAHPRLPSGPAGTSAHSAGGASGAGGQSHSRFQPAPRWADREWATISSVLKQPCWLDWWKFVGRFLQGTTVSGQFDDPEPDQPEQNSSINAGSTSSMSTVLEREPQVSLIVYCLRKPNISLISMY